MKNNVWKNMTKLDWAIRYALRFVGKWYKWGGDDPKGFDCSGLVVELLQAVGIIDRSKDFTAAMLYDLFPRGYSKPKAGRLVFYLGDHEKIVHVEFCVSDKLTIGASGGGRNTLTEADAIRDNAFIKLRPVNTARRIAGYVDPFADVNDD